MTATDILVLALPVDRDRAEQVLDGLYQAKVAGVHSTRIETPDPNSLQWRSATSLARDSRCVLFCWSRATAAPEAAPLRALGAELLARNTALSVEFDSGAAPAEMAGATTYPAHGWRCRPGAVLRFLFGDIHRLQIAVAAQRKVSGQDPPPPVAFWRLLSGRGWIALGSGIGLLLTASGLWSVWNDNALARLLDPALNTEFVKGRDKHDCSAMRAFAMRHPGSPWSGDVTEFLTNCRVRDIQVDRTDVQRLRLFASNRGEAEAEAKSVCMTAASNIGGQLVEARLASLEGTGMGWADCRISHMMVERRETYGK